MDDIYADINDYNPKRKWTMFDDMISHVMFDKKAQSVLKELFIRCRKYIILFSNLILFFCLKRCEIKLYSLYDF